MECTCALKFVNFPLYLYALIITTMGLLVVKDYEDLIGIEVKTENGDDLLNAGKGPHEAVGDKMSHGAPHA